MKRTPKSILLAALMAVCLPLTAGAAKNTWTLSSPNGRIKAEVKANGKVSYSVTFDGKTILAPSEIGMSLDNGTVYGKDKVKGTKTGKNIEHGLPAVAYKKAAVDDIYNWLTVSFKDYDVEFRAYDNAVAYRFVSTDRKGKFNVESEKAEFNFKGIKKGY